MRLLIGFGLMMLMGCASLRGILTPSTPPVAAPVCVARYAPLGPGVDLGLDDCDNFWVRYVADDSVKCAILQNGAMIYIPCPEEGEVLGD